VGGSRVIPIHAQGFFSVPPRRGYIYEVLVFDYYDPEEYYAVLIHRPVEYEEEMARLTANMQGFLDSETIEINGRRSKPRVRTVSLEFRGDPSSPYLTFIIYFYADLRRGVNRYVNIYEESEAEYDYEVYWMLPPRARFIEVDVASEYEVLGDGNILLFWARRGDRLPGREEIAFELH
jgi:hypothetical protein